MKRETINLFKDIFKVLEPPPDLTLSQWADKYRRLSSESSAEPGRWRTSKAPYQREIMDAVCDMRVQKNRYHVGGADRENRRVDSKSYRLLYALRPVADHGNATDNPDGGNVQQRPPFPYATGHAGSTGPGER